MDTKRQRSCHHKKRAQFTICCFHQRCFLVLIKDKAANANENKSNGCKKDDKDGGHAGLQELNFREIQTFGPSLVRHLSHWALSAVHVIYVITYGPSRALNAFPGVVSDKNVPGGQSSWQNDLGGTVCHDFALHLIMVTFNWRFCFRSFSHEPITRLITGEC